VNGRAVAWFSCGVASAVATKLALASMDNVVIARCLVREEHPDNDRFAQDCEHWFGCPIVSLIAETYDGSVMNVISRRKYISGIDGAPCTRLLKGDMRRAFELPGDVHVMGYCAEERDRWDRFLDSNNINAVAPLIERGLSHQDCLAIVGDAGIRLPEMYRLGYEHNNCIGCVKATGAGYWAKIRQDFPNRFRQMSVASRAVGSRMTRIAGERIFLDELPANTTPADDSPIGQCGIFCEMAKDELRKDSSTAPERSIP
jgi:hypothetical protein